MADSIVSFEIWKYEIVQSFLSDYLCKRYEKKIKTSSEVIPL